MKQYMVPSITIYTMRTVVIGMIHRLIGEYCTSDTELSQETINNVAQSGLSISIVKPNY